MQLQDNVESFGSKGGVGGVKGDGGGGRDSAESNRGVCRNGWQRKGMQGWRPGMVAGITSPFQTNPELKIKVH